MAAKLFPLALLQLLVLQFQLPLITVGNLLSSQQTTQCHEHESSSLLQFKESFIINRYASYYQCGIVGHSMVATWTKAKDCCSWEGVTCDIRTGHVIRLDLSCNWLYGSINSSSTIFNLVHLRRLNLFGNHFNFSQIPSNIGNLSKLTHLNLSSSFFSGEIPSDMSKLSKLVYLGLCCNYDSRNQRNLLSLNNLNFISFVGNMTNLRVLSLGYVDIMSPVPSIITNLSSLTYLYLESCGLYGEFPVGIFHLPNLHDLSLRSNFNLTGYLPEFHSSIALQALDLGGTSFGGKLPTSIGNINSLWYMDVSYCKFCGFLPPSFSNLTQLIRLELQYNTFDGSIPSYFTNMTDLIVLDLSSNRFHGSLPNCLSSLQNLEYLGLGFNNLEGNLELNSFLKLKNLFALTLSYNKFSMQTEESSNLTLTKIQALGLASCNLNYFPSFLSALDELEYLDISANSISTPLPQWLWNSNSQKLEYMNLSHNALTGEVPRSICELESLRVLELSHNAFEGSLPLCFGSLSQSLRTLRLKSNNFVGAISEMNLKSCSLIEIDFSQNNFHGKVPRSWVGCTNLEYVDLSYNKINDSFPAWLGSLPNLKILLLQSNAFHGRIEEPEKNLAFPMLHIIDLSCNYFSGLLPSDHFKLWNSMKIKDKEKLQYGRWNYTRLKYGGPYSENYPFSVNIYNKGTQLDYRSIQNFFYLMVIDFSSNKFVGTIPDSIGDLIGLCALNLSNNMLSGSIPSALSKLEALESLDLSYNRLSGRIPQQLSDLTFLEVFDVSHNRLVGPIPQGPQLDSFQSSSFEGNPGLCGNQLPKKCEAPKDPPQLPSSFDDDDQEEGGLFQFDWKVVVIGYGGGLAIGLVLGSTFIDVKKLGWRSRIF